MLQRYDTAEGLELVIDNQTGEVFASQSATARMCNCVESTIRYWITSQNIVTKSAEILTTQGLRLSQLLDEDAIYQALAKYNPLILVQCAKLGLRVRLHQLAGFTISSTAVSNQTLDDSVEDNALALVSELIDQMGASVGDPLAVSRYAKAIEVLNVTLHRKQPVRKNKNKSDCIAEFLDKSVEEFKGEKVVAKDLFNEYRRFCRKNKYLQETMTSFGTYVGTLYEKKRTNKGVTYIDIRLK